jgi:flagellar basal-body rod modification protein FlgD
MAIDAAAAVKSAASSSSASTASSNAAATKALSSNYTMFLKLLTTQLQNQDPLSPTDSTTFTQQLVAYSQVEQQIKTNDNLTSLIDNTKTSNVTLLNYLDKYVEVSGEKFPLQNSTATMTYQLASAASKVTLDILDSSGVKVASFDGPAGAGLQKISWDGKDSKSAQLSDGQYTLNITATDVNGKAITVSQQSMIGKVSGVEHSDSGNLLDVGKMQVKESDIVNVFNTASAKVS